METKMDIAKIEEIQLESARELYFERKAEQEHKCCVCGRDEAEIKADERGELEEHKIDSSWKSVLICDECYADIEESCE